jgi:hypothetical protein
MRKRGHTRAAAIPANPEPTTTQSYSSIAFSFSRIGYKSKKSSNFYQKIYLLKQKQLSDGD